MYGGLHTSGFGSRIKYSTVNSYTTLTVGCWFDRTPKEESAYKIHLVFSFIQIMQTPTPQKAALEWWPEREFFRWIIYHREFRASGVSMDGGHGDDDVEIYTSWKYFALWIQSTFHCLYLHISHVCFVVLLRLRGKNVTCHATSEDIIQIWNL